MAERAAHLVDRVLPAVPLRQWVLTVPHRLRYLMVGSQTLARRGLLPSGADEAERDVAADLSAPLALLHGLVDTLQLDR